VLSHSLPGPILPHTCSTEVQTMVGSAAVLISTPAASRRVAVCCTNGTAFWHFTASSSTPNVRCTRHCTAACSKGLCGQAIVKTFPEAAPSEQALHRSQASSFKHRNNLSARRGSKSRDSFSVLGSFKADKTNQSALQVQMWSIRQLWGSLEDCSSAVPSASATLDCRSGSAKLS